MLVFTKKETIYTKEYNTTKEREKDPSVFLTTTTEQIQTKCIFDTL